MFELFSLEQTTLSTCFETTDEMRTRRGYRTTDRMRSKADLCDSNLVHVGTARE